jgi:protein-tyrosine phosphatase
LAIGAPALANSLRTIASAESLPAVFHCAAGKDRTGVLAAMVLSLVGVDEETIMGDYLLSGIAMDSLVERLKRDSPESLTAMNDQPSAYLAAPREAMAMFLAHVNSTYGSMTHYVNHIGIESDVIDSLQANLLD